MLRYYIIKTTHSDMKVDESKGKSLNLEMIFGVVGTDTRCPFLCDRSVEISFGLRERGRAQTFAA